MIVFNDDGLPTFTAGEDMTQSVNRAIPAGLVFDANGDAWIVAVRPDENVALKFDAEAEAYLIRRLSIPREDRNKPKEAPDAR